VSRTRTLAELRSDIRDQASINGFSVRHSDTLLTRLVNQEIQAHRAEVSLDGVTNYLSFYSSTFTTGNTSPHKFALLDLSSGPSPALVRPYGLDIIVNDTSQKTLKAVSMSERADYGGQPGEPEAWAQYQSYKLAIFPAPATAYTYILSYLGKLTDLSADADTFDGVEGWEDRVVWGVVARVTARDQFPEAYSMAVSERERAAAKVLQTARQTGKGVIHRRRDTWGERQRDMRLRRSPWFPYR